MLDLVDLYNRVGIKDYNWKVCGPDLGEIKWMYHTFDPPEEKLWEPGTRYRKVTYPKGMENWFVQDFDAEKAGWKPGFAPFGQFGGKLITEKGDCDMSFCRCGDPMKTFWDKEVLLVQTKIKLPKFEDGHIYRLVIGGMSHVNHGDGVRVYVNGKQIYERDSGVGKRAGNQPICAYLDKSWWPVFDKEVTVSATSYLPIPGGKRSPGVKKNHFSIFFQEMKAPPITDDMIKKGKVLQPLMSSQWQSTKQDGDKYRYNGTFAANGDVVGEWVQIAQVNSMDEFEPGKDFSANGKSPLEKINILADGKTGNDQMIWSGDTVMDFVKGQALKMQTAKIAGKDFLFVESGGFSSKNPDDWTTKWTVMSRAGK
jgi:hypothetical protein